MTGKRRIMKRVTKADKIIGMPTLNANKSKKYQTLGDSLEKTLFMLETFGSNGTSNAINSVQTKYSAKYTTNLMMIERKTKPSTELKAEKTMPNIATPKPLKQ